MKKLKKTKKPKPAVKAKPIKKNTTYRRFRAWEIRLDRRMQRQRVMPQCVDETHRECSNCGYSFTGRICPQCGQAATWRRYSWRQAFLNLLDIWGLGNRPMFRTLHELFTRPGYMVREYLGGHRQFYFPPFKLLAVSVVLMIFVSWLTGVKYNSYFGEIAEELVGKDFNITGGLGFLADIGIKFIELLSSNLLYEWLFLGVVAVIGVWIGFNHYQKYNFVETYIFLVFVMAQQLLCMIPDMLGTGFCNFVDHCTSGSTSGGAVVCASVVSMVRGVVSKLYSWAVMLLVVMDFRQFYGLKWKTALWRMILVVAVLLGIGVMIAVIYLAVAENSIKYGVAVLNCILIIAAFVLANRLIDKNKPKVHPSVITTCKVLMISVLLTPIWSITFSKQEYSVVSSALIVTLYFVLAVTFSILPMLLYNKTHRRWLSILVPVFLVLATVIITFKVWRLL